VKGTKEGQLNQVPLVPDTTPAEDGPMAKVFVMDFLYLTSHHELDRVAELGLPEPGPSRSERRHHYLPTSRRGFRVVRDTIVISRPRLGYVSFDN